MTVARPLTINGPGSVIDGRDTAGYGRSAVLDDRERQRRVVDGFTMRYANPAATGRAARRTDGMSNVTISQLRPVLGGDVDGRLRRANDSTSELLDPRRRADGRSGSAINGTHAGLRNPLIGNRIYHNNRTGEPDPRRRCRLKATLQHNLLLDGNEVYDNGKGPLARRG